MAKNCKYQKYQKYVSYDNGATWQPMQEFQKGELIEASSTDCGGGTVVYQWVVDSYYCNNSDRYATEKKQVSYNNGQSWEDVVPTETKSTLVERNSPYCGSYQYRWVESGTTCIGYDKWQNNIRQVSRDGGQTWENVSPPEYSASTVIEYNSEDCGYVPPTPTQYRWYPSGTTCISYDKYQNNIKQISYDSGQTWENVSPPQYSASTLIEHNSEDCGYVPPTPVEYRWYPSGYTCIGYDKWQNNIKQQSTDGGETWTNVSPPEYSASTVIEYNSEDCGYVPPTPVEYRWYPSGTTCISYDKYQNNIKQQSTDGGETWENVIPEEYSASTLIEADSEDCGYVPPTPTFDGKWLATYSDSHTESAECIGNSSSAITSGEITLRSAITTFEIGQCVRSIHRNAFDSCTSLTSITIPSSVTFIGYAAFNNCSSLTSVTIPNSVTTISTGVFEWCEALTSVSIGSGVTAIEQDAFWACPSLTSMTITAPTPPIIRSNSMGGTYPIYVPSGSVETYKSAYKKGWEDYADRIQAIPNS